MLVTLALAEKATDNDDGTVSAQRMGLTAVRQRGKPVTVDAVVYLVAEVEDVGKHKLALHMQAVDGQAIAPVREYDAEFKRANQRVIYVPRYTFHLRPGAYQLVLQFGARTFASPFGVSD